MCITEDYPLLNQFAANLRNLQDEEGTEVCCAYKGVLIYITGAFCMALGVNLQKYSINQEQLRHPAESDRRSLYRQPFWVLGLLTYGGSGALLSLALAFAKQSQLAPLMSVVIVSNALLARFLLGEPVSKRDTVAIGIIIGAVVISTVFAPGSHSELETTDGLIALYREGGFIAFVVILTLTLIIFYIGNRFVLGKIDEKPPKSSQCLISFCKAHRPLHKTTTVNPEKDDEDGPESDRSESTFFKVSRHEERFFAFSFGGQAGCWGGLCVTMMKSAISIIIDRFGADGIKGILTTPLMYILLLILILCWVMQLYWISAGLERYPAVFVVSIEAVLNELVAVCGGILYFKEYEQFTLVTAIMFTFGLLLGCFGIILFATRDNYELDDDFFTCCPLKPIQDPEHDPRVHEHPVDEISRTPSWKRQQPSTSRSQNLDDNLDLEPISRKESSATV